MITSFPNTASEGKTCIVVAGPTAVGKTAFAIKLAQFFKTEIISADSRQCYKELNIGVAKPSAEELEAVPHHFISSHSVHDTVNAAVFEQYALQKTGEIFKTNNVAVMVGGTGLYIKAFCEGMDAVPEVAATVRQQVIAGYEEGGMEWLQQQVQLNDPAYYALGEIRNPQRMMRALEVKLATGQSITSYQTHQKKQRDFTVVKVALELPREQLYQQINERVDKMLAEGLAAEAKSLFHLRHLNALQTVGYKELFNCFEGAVTMETAIAEIKQNTRHYAKRQVTWFKKDAAWKWVSPQYPPSALAAGISWGR